MIALIISIAALFYWLMRETNWLKVNLYPTDLIAKPELPEPTYQEIAELETRFKLQHRPVCGWAWLFANQDAYKDGIPCELSMVYDGFRATVSLKDASVVKKLVKTITEPHKPVKNVYPYTHYKSGVTLGSRWHTDQATYNRRVQEWASA